MKKAKELILNNIDIIFFIFIMSIKVITYGKEVQGQFFTLKNIFLPVLVSILVFVGISFIFKKKSRVKFLYTLNIILSSLVVADLVYYGYFRDILSISVVKNGILLGPVKSSIAALFKPYYLLYFVDILLLPRFLYRVMPSKENKLKMRIAAFVIVLAVSSSASGYYIYRLSVEQPRLITTMYNRIYIAESLGNVTYHELDIYNLFQRTLQKNTPLSDDKKAEIKNYLAKKSNPENVIMKNEGKGKNLIVVQVEALQQFVIGRSINGQEITPNLNIWLKRSVYFDNYYYQVAAGNTSDAEFMTNNSLYPAASGAACYLYDSNYFMSLPKAMDKKGYKSYALHGFREDFWNRSVMNKTEGYDNFFGQKSYNVNEVVGLGISDKSFLTQSISRLKSFKEPYYAFLVTLSSHFPFDDTKHYGELNVGEYENSMLGNYLKAIHYTDEQLGMFFDKLDEEGITKNSVIALYGDHYAIPKSEQDSLDKFLNISKGNDLNWMELQKVPLILHFPDDKHAAVNHLFGGEMDLYPTLANLFNLPKDTMLGKDLFNSSTGNVVFRNGSFTDGNVFYLSQEDKYYDIKSGNIIPQSDELKSKKSDAQTQLEYSDDIVNHDLYKKFYGSK